MLSAKLWRARQLISCSQAQQDMFALLRHLVTTAECDKDRQLTIHNDTCWMRLVLLSKPERRQNQLSVAGT